MFANVALLIAIFIRTRFVVKNHFSNQTDEAYTHKGHSLKLGATRLFLINPCYRSDKNC